MIDKNLLVEVTNRDNGRVGYVIPDMNNLHRVFMPKETKSITYDELCKLNVIAGGQTLIKDCLIIHNSEVLKDLLGDVEPEYFYSENEIKDLLLNGSVEQLLDCLDFAPLGVIDLIKDFAVKLEINDIRKRNAIFNKTGFNVTKAIEINKETFGSAEETKATPTRRTNLPKYKVVNKK